MKAQGALSGGLESLGRRMSSVGFHAPENQPQGRGERERERRKDMGTQALMEQRCFNDLSVSIYRMLYKKFLWAMIKIRKPNVQQLLPREQGINNGHKVMRQLISQERRLRLSSFVVRRMFTEGDSRVSHPMTSVLGASCHSTRFCCQKLLRNRGFIRNSTQESSF